MKKIVILLFLVLIAVVVLWRISPEQITAETANQAPSQASASSDPVLVTDTTRAPIVIKANAKYSAPVQAKLKILEEVLNSKNDNDPRLDSEFEKISDEVKLALIETYGALPKESLNERGTVVFLLGRNITTEKDLEFFQELLVESPCLSLADCSKENMVENPGDEHLVESQATTLIYPQLMALRLVSASYGESKNTALKERIRDFFRTAEQSPSEYLGEEAKRIAEEAGIKTTP